MPNTQEVDRKLLAAVLQLLHDDEDVQLEDLVYAVGVASLQAHRDGQTEALRTAVLALAGAGPVAVIREAVTIPAPQEAPPSQTQQPTLLQRLQQQAAPTSTTPVPTPPKSGASRPVDPPQQPAAANGPSQSDLPTKTGRRPSAL